MNEPVDRKSIGVPSSVQGMGATSSRVHPGFASREMAPGPLSHRKWCTEQAPEIVVDAGSEILTCPSSNCCARRVGCSFSGTARVAFCVPHQLSIVVSARICFPPEKNSWGYLPWVSMSRAAAVRAIQPEDQARPRKGSQEVLDWIRKGGRVGRQYGWSTGAALDRAVQRNERREYALIFREVDCILICSLMACP